MIRQPVYYGGNIPSMSVEVLLIRSRPVADQGRYLNTLRMFREHGFTARTLCWDRQRQRPKTETIEGFFVRNARVPGAFSNRSLLFWVPLWWVYEFFYLIFHPAHCYYAADLDTAVPVLIWVKFLRLFGLKPSFVFDIADFYTAKAMALPKPLYRPLNAVERLLAVQADATVIPDEARVYLLEGAQPKRLFFVPNTSYDKVKPEWEKKDNHELVLFCAGSLTPDRGVTKLIEATKGLDRVRVVFAGRAISQEQVEEFQQSPHVEYLGLIPQEEVLHRTVEADVVYSYYDPSLEINKTANSTKIFEAMMCGTAILCNSEPPSTRIVQETGCGVCLPYSDDDGLRQTIIQWRDLREITREMGRRGRKAFEERYSWPVTAAPLAAFLHELLGH